MAVVLPNPRRWNPAKKGRYVEHNMHRIMGRMRASELLPEEAADVSPEDIRIDTSTVMPVTAMVPAAQVGVPGGHEAAQP
jgi:membrane peptidoglycan carboxypeptidase